jgi:hypothetical protein
MFNSVWGRIPRVLRERPFDIYTAFLVVLVGIYSIVDTTFPELQEDTINNVIINIAALYLIFSGMTIIVAMLVIKRNPIFSFYAEMYGWAFMSSATLAVGIFQVYNAIVSNNNSITNWYLFWTVFFIWSSITIVAMIKSVDMFVNLRKRK